MSETQTRRYTHIVKRQSGYVAGWHHSREEAVAFEAECNFAVPGDPAHTEELEGDEAWDGLVAEAAEHEGVPVAEILARYPGRCHTCQDPEHDTCSLTAGCSCCEDTLLQLAELNAVRNEPYPSQEYDDVTYALNHPENELS